MPLKKLICFPYAGGTQYVFAPWQRALHGRLDVIAPELPGRGVRMAKPAIDRLADLVAWLRRELRDTLTGDYALWGHSMGALAAYELARSLHADGQPLPRHLFVTGARPPYLLRDAERCHELDDDALIDKLSRMAGTPPQVLANRELMALLLPSLRADFAVCETYAWQEEPMLPDLPITVVGGDRDPDVLPTQLPGWRRCTQGPVRVMTMTGDHFFLRDQVDALRDLFVETLSVPATTRTSA